MADQISLTSLLHYFLYSQNKRCGSVVDFYLHDKSWVVEYIVIELGNHFFSKKVLFPPGMIITIDKNAKRLITSSNTEEIESLPNATDVLTVSQMHGLQTYSSKQWSYYWRMRRSPDQHIVSEMLDIEEKAIKDALKNDQFAGTHLRNYSELLVYTIMDSFNHGHLKDILVDKNSWQAISVISENGCFWNRKREVIDSACISEIKWSKKEIKVKFRNS